MPIKKNVILSFLISLFLVTTKGTAQEQKRSKSLIHHIQFSPLIEGVGLSLDYRLTSQKSKTIGYGGGLNFSSYLFKNPYGFVSPYVTYQFYDVGPVVGAFFRTYLGYGIPVSGGSAAFTSFDASGGVFTGAQVGMLFTKGKPYIEVGAGYRYQKASFVYDVGGSTINEKINFRRLELIVGVSF